MTLKPMQQDSARVWRLVVALAASMLAACAQTPVRPQYASVDDVVTNVRDPAMQELWREAQARGALPPVNRIPVAETPVSQRKVAQVERVPAQTKRPLIPKEAVVAVQPFSAEGITSYDGRFDVVSHEVGIIKGRLREPAPTLEILYRLPGENKVARAEASATLNLTYRDEVVGNALQRRIVLQDPRTKLAPLIVIAEGSSKPYRTAIEELGLTIEQASAGASPPVTVRFMGQAVSLREGETASIGTGERRLSIYLLNSYAQDKQHAQVDPGQPYYVNIILYQ